MNASISLILKWRIDFSYGDVVAEGELMCFFLFHFIFCVILLWIYSLFWKYFKLRIIFYDGSDASYFCVL